MSGIANPMHQFEVTPLLPLSLDGYNIAFTNATLWKLFALLAIVAFLGFAVRTISVRPKRLQAAAELLYNFVTEMVSDNAGDNGKKYAPFIFTIFMFVLTCNLFGMIPYSFTVTSHIAVTFALAAFIFVLITLIGFIRHGFHFFSLFLPSGVPAVMSPLIFVIELFTYLVRPFSLSLRLAANMTAGHVVLKVIAGFVIMFPFISIAPFAMLVALTGFEIFIAMLQAYIFTILTCVYLNDALNLH